jgi:hypothetical protein
MTDRNDEDVKVRIHQAAAKYAEANVYSMNNPYLSRWQKALVEAWFQFPIGVFSYILMGHLAVYSYQYVDAFIAAYVIASAISLMARYVQLPDGVLVALGFAFAGWVETAVSLAFLGFFVYERAWGATAISVACATGLISAVAPSMHLYTLLRSPRGMNAKYGFAKSRFGISFPFEERS